jgi:HAD superfamily hydrolase (TIGR01450 family)
MHVPRIVGSAAATTFSIHKSLSEIAPLYDAFILDQYGVLHNGAVGLPGAPECIAELANLGKKMIILSNTSGPASAALAKLPNYGYDSNQFVGAVTSGEESSKYIRATYGSNDDEQVKRCVWFTWDGQGNMPNLLDYLAKCGSNVQPATSVEEADFVLAHGAHVWQRGFDEQISLGSFLTTGNLDMVVEPILQDCLARDLPMVCANPDFVVRLPDGSTGYMPGNIARRYEEMGGHCKSFGKPNPEHFEACLEQLGSAGLDPSRVLHVGDSLHHDIAGANAANVASLLITSGIHCDELEAEFGVLPDEGLLKELLEREGHVPTHVMSAFRF